MHHIEKKYRLDSFIQALALLKEKGAHAVKRVVNTHYYAQKEGNDVVKLIEYADRNEIHILAESQGKYTLTEKIPMQSREAGLQWLKEKGYKVVDIVKMDYTDYEYDGGVVGLYLINDFLHSLILDYPEGQHEKKEK